MNAPSDTQEELEEQPLPTMEQFRALPNSIGKRRLYEEIRAHVHA